MKYDDANWHYGGDFPPDSPREYGGTHIALFMKWCFTKGWASTLHTDEEPKETQKVIDGELSATEYFFMCCDGKLTNEEFNDDGNAFAEKYYGPDGLYLDDYCKHFGGNMYTAPESAHDFQAFSSVLDSRLNSHILTKAQEKHGYKQGKGIISALLRFLKP